MNQECLQLAVNLALPSLKHPVSKTQTKSQCKPQKPAGYSGLENLVRIGSGLGFDDF